MQLELDGFEMVCMECKRKLPKPDKQGWIECECGDLQHFEVYMIVYGFHPDYQGNKESNGLPF